MTAPSTRRFVVLLALTALAGAALVLVVPWTVRPDGGVPPGVPVLLAAVCLGGGIAARAARPDAVKRHAHKSLRNDPGR